MTPIADHFAAANAPPALIRLHDALTRLKSVVTLMNTGAHPDDEDSALLAYLRFAHGVRPVIACSTRGEGGQNVLGPERGGALGVLRSHEMEEAARLLDADLIWLGHGPDDPVHDFGFSKNGEDCLARWGHQRLLERLVRAYREERPDIVLPTFLDVPGQHGHHRAMTRAAQEALALAADPTAFPEHLAQGLQPWQVSKFYLPAISGASYAYDDEVPPPPATLTLRQDARDPARGLDYDMIGQISRYAHASQSMGHWPEEPRREWPLHLVYPADTTESALFDGLPYNLAALARHANEDLAQLLLQAQLNIDTACKAFPDRGAIANALATAATRLEQAIEAADPLFMSRHGHRLRLKLREIDHALFTCAGLIHDATCSHAMPRPQEVVLVQARRTKQPWLDDAHIQSVQARMPSGLGTARTLSQDTLEITLSSEAQSPLFASSWQRLGGNGVIGIKLRAQIAGRMCQQDLDLAQSLQIRPAVSLTLQSDTLIFAAGNEASQTVTASGAQDFDLELPAGWKAARHGADITLTPPKGANGRYNLPAIWNGLPAYKVTEITRRPNAPPLVWQSPAQIRSLCLELQLHKEARVGYIGGGADQLHLWLERMGVNVEVLDDNAVHQDLGRFSTVVIGVLAFGTRPILWNIIQKLHEFIQSGGHLVTFYQRPNDGWNAHTTPPHFLQIGSPSLRWRVCDPNAPVRILQPEHPLLIGPNIITANDFTDWNKERGLYFASKWDPRYEALLAITDRGEGPLMGGFLSATIGKGRHSHIALNLHHQLDQLTAGAFRLMANLIT